MKKQLLFEFKQLKKLKAFSLFALAFMATINITYAQSTWVGGVSTDFLDAANWTPTPTFNSTTIFTIGAGTYNPTLGSAGYPKTSGAPTVGGIVLSNLGVFNASGSINVNSASYWEGVFTVNGGTTNVRNSLYFGSSSTAGTVTATGNIESNGALNVKTFLIISNKQPAIFNVNGGTVTADTGGSIAVGNYPQYGGCNGILNLNSGTVHVKTNGLTIGTKGTVNIYGGLLDIVAGNTSIANKLNINGGDVKLLAGTNTINSSGTNTAGVVNITGGTMDIAGPLTIGAGTININSGLMNFSAAGALTITGSSVINLDAGRIVLIGDQTTAMATYISSNTIKLSPAAVTAGKTLTNTFDSVTGLTTVIAVSPPTTWTTTWSNGAPSATVEAIIDGSYSTTTNGSFTAKKLTINTGKSLTINSGTTVTVQNEVISNGTTVVENNANLIQVLGTTNTNIGNITINRNSSPLLRLDYTLWSSPVAGQNLASFSPLTSQSPSRFYTYDTANNQYSNTFDPTTTNFTAGTGYLIRVPNTADAGTPTAYAGQFTGVPNNGDVSFNLSTAGSGYNLVGNPYPSPITAATLVANNSGVIATTMYFWRKTNGIGTAYCTYNTSGSVFTTNGNTQSVDPAGVIQTGQAFFVQAIAPGSLVFNNGQRSTNTTGQFFKTKQVATADKIWLNATNATGDFSQMAVNYTQGATQGVDDFDGKYINDSPLALTSNINNDEYTIQGRPAFDAADVVPLNFKTAVAGDYTIAIDHSEGVFAAGQSVILTDATTGTETDLTKSAYTFTAPTGTASSRFSLKYQKTLGTNKAAINDNNVVVYKSKGTLYVNAGDATIANIKVYDVQGKLVAELKNVKASSATIANLKATNQVLVVKITSQDNKVVTKKVVN
jgi:hypothetical protein